VGFAELKWVNLCCFVATFFLLILTSLINDYFFENRFASQNTISLFFSQFREPLSTNVDKIISQWQQRLSKHSLCSRTFALEATEISHLRNYLCERKKHKNCTSTRRSARKFCINLAQLNDFSSVSLNIFLQRARMKRIG
jgi:hypothetical protein